MHLTYLQSPVILNESVISFNGSSCAPGRYYLVDLNFYVSNFGTSLSDLDTDLLSSEAFSMDPNTGLVRSRRMLLSSERFNLTVVATDQGRPPLWSTADLIITVVDVNDNRPVFVRPANGTIIHILEVSAAA